MPIPFRSQSAHYASRLFSRRPLDLRAQLVALHSTASAASSMGGPATCRARAPE